MIILELFAQISGWIVLPLLLAIFIGKKLDTHFQTEPYLLLACVGVAFTITLVGLVKQAKTALKNIAEASRKR